MTKCKWCGSVYASYTKVCPVCNRRVSSQRKNWYIFIYLLGALVAVTIVWSVLYSYRELNEDNLEQTPDRRIPYHLVDASSLYTADRIIVSQDNATEPDLIDLGNTLRYDLRNKKGVVQILVYDDLESAKILTQERRNAYAMGSLDDHSLDKYYKHHIATYWKNTYTGHHSYAIFLDGSLGDRQIDIDYSKKENYR